ncbi:MAG TPA: hypothetical protein VIN75_12540 [Burkholderiaceae bacterium]
MARTPSPLHDTSAPRRVSKPAVRAQAAAPTAEPVAAPAPATRKSGAAETRAASPAKKAASAGKSDAAKVAPAKKSRAPSVAKAEPATAGAPASAPAKLAKAHKPKLVRDSFTIPKDEYAVLDALKARALGLGQHVRKSELLRAGIQALHAMNDRALLAAVGAVPTLKTGRPRKG